MTDEQKDQTARIAALLDGLDVLYKASNDLDAIVRPNRAAAVVETWLADRPPVPETAGEMLRRQDALLSVKHGATTDQTARIAEELRRLAHRDFDNGPYRPPLTSFNLLTEAADLLTAQQAALEEAQTRYGFTREALVVARDVLATFGTQAGYLPEQQGYSTRMTEAEHRLARAVAEIDRLLSEANTSGGWR